MKHSFKNSMFVFLMLMSLLVSALGVVPVYASANSIVYSGIRNTVISQYDSNTFSLFDNPAAWDDFYPDVFVADFSNPYMYEAENMMAVHGNHVWFAEDGSYTSAAAKFQNGDAIDSNLSFAVDSYESYCDTFIDTEDNFTSTYGNFCGQAGYTGFVMNDGVNNYYGWMQLRVDNYNNSNISLTIIDWAYETTPNTPIAAGATFAQGTDTTAPTTSIDSGPDLSTSSDSATFTFSATDDVSDPANLTFECVFDAGNWEPCTSPKTYTGLSSGNHWVWIRAYDEAGNTDSSGVYYGWHVATTDTTAPDTSITADLANTSTSGSFSFTGSDNVTDPANLTYECRLDFGFYGAWYACSSPFAYDTSYPEGVYTLNVRAIDGASNVDSTPATVTWTIAIPKERLQNGGFNTFITSRNPAIWKITQLGTTDGKDAKNKQEGTASIKLIGATGKTKTLTQTVSVSGTSGDQLTFSFWAAGKSIPTKGTCSATVTLKDGSATVLTKTIPCKTGSYSAFQQKTLSFTALSNFTSITVKFTYAKASGTVWFDGVSLIK